MFKYYLDVVHVRVCVCVRMTGYFLITTDLGDKVYSRLGLSSHLNFNTLKFNLELCFANFDQACDCKL